MRWIGLTGPMGSGKSTVSAILREGGYVAIDADQIAHQVLGPSQPGEVQIFKSFGESLRGPDGKLDRRALGRLVFNDSEKLARLEGIVHPLVRAEVEREKSRLSGLGVPAAFYDVPLLFEKKMEAQFDAVLVVTASDQVRRERLAKRSQMSEAEFIERSRHHIPVSQKIARAHAVVYNEGDLAALKSEVARALNSLSLSLPASAKA